MNLPAGSFALDVAQVFQPLQQFLLFEIGEILAVLDDPGTVL